tara:strand:+ start:127 stop:321 length:195 start_codon:yes stop_codon:yes gene_type:complete
MIKGSSSRKSLTPKQKAQEIIRHAIDNAAMVLGDDDMTEREEALVMEQFEKLEARITKNFTDRN